MKIEVDVVGDELGGHIEYNGKIWRPDDNGSDMTCRACLVKIPGEDGKSFDANMRIIVENRKIRKTAGDDAKKSLEAFAAALEADGKPYGARAVGEMIADITRWSVCR